MSDPDSRENPAEEDLLTRRVFVKTCLGAAGLFYAGTIGYPIYRYLATPASRAAKASAVNEVVIPKSDLPEAGSALMFQFGFRPALLIHHTDGSLVCLDAVCTHLGCTVQYQPEKDRIFCACHSGEYDAKSGKNVAGPPPKPLTAYRTQVEQDQIIIARV